MTIHLPKYYLVAGHNMSMPYCGLDDNENCEYSEHEADITCKRCLNKLNKCNLVTGDVPE